VADHADDHPNVISFEEALRLAEQAEARPHVLLGNGFSIAYDHTAVLYGRSWMKPTSPSCQSTRAPSSSSSAPPTSSRSSRSCAPQPSCCGSTRPPTLPSQGRSPPTPNASRTAGRGAGPQAPGQRRHRHAREYAVGPAGSWRTSNASTPSTTTFCCTGPRSRTDRSASSPTTGSARARKSRAQMGGLATDGRLLSQRILLPPRGAAPIRRRQPSSAS